MLTRTPSPQWEGMRPKRSWPNGVMTSAQTRFRVMESVYEFWPLVGEIWLCENAGIG